MRYRVVFKKRFNGEGEESDQPQNMLDLPDGVVTDAAFVERFEPENLHVEERMDEDDDFMAFGTEVWEYEITPGRESEFIDAVKTAEIGMEIEEVGEDNMPSIAGQG